MIINNVIIIDGNRLPQYRGTIIIKDEKIEKILKDTEPYNTEGEIVIDGKGKYISPGFIDIHSHSDSCPILYNNPDSKIFQGITSELVGSCGISPYPGSLNDYLYMSGNQHVANKFDNYRNFANSYNEYKKAIEPIGISNNYYSQVGHGALRANVIGFENREANLEEIHKMCLLLEEQLIQGAVGMSLGLIYPPGIFADNLELLELSKTLKKHNKLLTVHMRNEGSGVFDSVNEMIKISKQTGVRLQLSHLKLVGKNQWGKSDELLYMIEKSRDEGIEVTCDQYPYVATSTRLSAVIPKWAQDGGKQAVIKNLYDLNETLQRDIENEVINRGGYNNIIVATAGTGESSWIGKSVSDLAEINNLSNIDMLVKMLIESDLDSRANYFSLSEEDVLNIMKRLYVSVGSDGYAVNTEESKGTNLHPRNFGTFPEYFELVRKHNLLSIEDAVYKATKLNADIMNIQDRGLVKEDYYADLCIFDWDNLKGESSYLDPIKRAKGIDYLIVNGEIVISEGNFQMNYPGKVENN